MKGVGELLIDMHGQNEHQLLLRNNQQRDLFLTLAIGVVTILAAAV
jgi:DNA repair ATPase RecN